MFWFLACGILALQPGRKPAPPALEDEVLTSRPPGKSLWFSYRKFDRRDGNPRSEVNLPCRSCPLLVLEESWPLLDHVPSLGHRQWI